MACSSAGDAPANTDLIVRLKPDRSRDRFIVHRLYIKMQISVT